MINALLLIFDPVGVWDRIIQARRSVGFVFVTYLLPLVLLGTVATGFGMMNSGANVKWIAGPEFTGRTPMSTRQVLVYASARFLLWLIVVFGSAHTIKALGETFHSRHTYRQAFVVAAYGLGPMFLLQLLQAFPMHPAVPWSIGIVLAFSILYHGVPKVMEPDPSHAFGLYLTTGILLALTSAAAVIALYCLAAWVLRQSFI